MNLVSNDALILAAAAEAVTLARAAVNAAREAAEESAAGVGGEVWIYRDGSEGNGLVMRRTRRRKRRKNLELLDLEEKGYFENKSFSSGSVKSGYLSRREEVDCCLSLKVPVSQCCSFSNSLFFNDQIKMLKKWVLS